MEEIQKCMVCKEDLASSTTLGCHTVLINYAKQTIETDPDEFKNCSHNSCYEICIQQGLRIHRSLIIAQIAHYARSVIDHGHLVELNDLWERYLSKSKRMFFGETSNCISKAEFRSIIEKQLNDGKQISKIIPKRYYIQDTVRQIDPDTCAEISQAAHCLYEDLTDDNAAPIKGVVKTPQSMQVFIDEFGRYTDGSGISHLRNMVEQRKTFSLNGSESGQKESLLEVQVIQRNQFRHTKQDTLHRRMTAANEQSTKKKKKTHQQTISISESSLSENNATQNEIISAAENGDEMHVISILDNCNPGKKSELSILAMQGAIANNDISMLQHLLLQHKISSKTSSKVNRISDPLICLYECIDRNNALMVQMITNQLFGSHSLEASIVLQVLTYAISQSTEAIIVRFIDSLLPATKRKSFDTYRLILSDIVPPFFRETQLEKITLYTQMKLGLFKLDKKGLQTIARIFPDVEPKIKHIYPQIDKRFKNKIEEHDLQKYVFEFLFSDHSLDDYIELHSTLAKFGSGHQFTRQISELDDIKIKNDIIRAVDFYQSDHLIKQERQEITIAIDDFINNLCQIIGYRNEILECKPRRVGSSVENTRPFSPDEYDFILSLLKLGRYFSLSCLQSFVFFTCNQEDNPLAENDLLDKASGKWYLNPDKLRAALNGLIHDILRDDISSIWSVLVNVSHSQSHNFQDEMKSLCSDPRLTIDPVAFFNGKKKFAAVTVIWRGAQFKYLPIKIDLVPAIEYHDCSILPTPQHDYLSDSETKPLYIVAFGSPVGFQICHTIHEAECIRDLPTNVVLGYTYAKAIRQSMVLQSEKSKPFIRNLNNYEEVCTSYMLKQAVLVLTKTKKPNISTNSPIQWAIHIFEKLRCFLTKTKRIPQFMMNPENKDTEECIFKLDVMHLSLRGREMQCLLAIFERVLEVLYAGEFLGNKPLRFLTEKVFKERTFPVDCLHFFSLLSCDTNECFECDTLLEIWHTYINKHTEDKKELKKTFPNLYSTIKCANILHNKDIPKMVVSSKLPSLAYVIDNYWTKQGETLIEEGTFNVRVIQNNLWMCHRRGITIFDANLRQLRRLSMFYNAQDFALMADGKLVVGASNGLYEASEDGSNKVKIQNGAFTSVVAYGSLVYAADRTRTVRILQCLDSEWIQHHVIDLYGISGNVGLSISNGKLFVWDSDNPALRTFTTNGAAVDKWDIRRTGFGDMKGSYICGSDAEGAVMVADTCNHRLQVRDSANEWHVIKLQPRVRAPRRAVLLDDTLFIVSDYSDSISSISKHTVSY